MFARVVVTVAVFLSFAADSFARYPVPGTNEPHYLAKARHYWEPDWCAGDQFLESADAHLVFYQTFGLLTRFLTFEAAATVGRLVGLMILAVGWTALLWQIVPGTWPALLAAWIFLGLAAAGNLSGEWIVGGIESKVVAYGLLFWAGSIWLDDQRARRAWRIPAAGVAFGLAISFHPVVGIWSLVAVIFASLADRLSQPNRGATRVTWPVKALAVCGGVVAATPGIIAGAKAGAGSSAAADFIQVYYRLAHHLDPMRFSDSALDRLIHDHDVGQFLTSAWMGYVLLGAAWLLGRRWLSHRAAESRFAWFVVGSALIAAAGLAIGWRTGAHEKMFWYATRWKLMKLYPFRLFDVMLPMACAVTVAGLAQRGSEWARSKKPIVRWIVPLIWAGLAAPAAIAMLHVASDARPAMTEQELADWLGACRWIDRTAPHDTLVLAPPQNWAFKWFAQRAEFVSYKDCPQDGAGIEEWNSRLKFVRKWAEDHFEGGYSVADVAPLVERGIHYIVAQRLGPFAFEPVYRNGTFRIYELPPHAPQPRVGAD